MHKRIRTICIGTHRPITHCFLPHERKLILFKMFIIDCFPIALIIVGCLKVNQGRKNNYGCGDQPLVAPPPDSGLFYNFFCVLIVSFAFELLVWPAISANKIMRWIRNHEVIQRSRYATEAKGKRLEQCLGGLLKCISVCCCNKQGGMELKNQGEMKDFAKNLVRFSFCASLMCEDLHCCSDLSCYAL